MAEDDDTKTEDDTKTGGESVEDAARDEQGDDGGGAGAKPPAKPGDAKAADAVTRAEYNALAAELRTARKEAKERKDKLAALEAANATEAERAIMQARQEAAAEREAALHPAVVKANARAALSSAGCTDRAVQTTLMRLIDAGKVELDDDGEISGGLDEQIEELKAQFPERFETKKPRVPSAREVDAGDKKPPAAKKSPTEQAVERLLGGGR